MFAEFRTQYPHGGIHTEMLSKIDGLHAFRAVISNDGKTLATAMGIDADLEIAEDRAVKRALVIAGITENYRLSATLEGDYAPLPALAPQQYTQPNLELKPETKQQPSPEVQPLQKPEMRSSAYEPPLDLNFENLPPAKQHTQKIEPKHEGYRDSSPIDLSDYITEIDVEMDRVGWDKKRGKEYIIANFQKQSRQHLNQQELSQFLLYLKSLPPLSNFAAEF